MFSRNLSARLFLFRGVCLATVLVGLVYLSYLFVGKSIVKLAYDGEGFLFLREYMEGASAQPLDGYYSKVRFYLTKLSIVIFFLPFVLTSCLYWRELSQSLRKFVQASDYAENLGIARIVVFSLLLDCALSRQQTIPSLLEQPVELRVPPIGMGWIFPYLPFDTATVEILWWCVFVSCIAAIFGLFTRLATFLAIALGIFVLGIPNFFGKVDHAAHHLIWFGTLLAFSPCGDALSVDSWIRKRKVGKYSSAYGTPLRYMWLLFGVVYFFPGIYKIWFAGVDWIFTDNLRYIMYGKWAEAPSFEPLFRIDRYPLLYRSGALFSVLFEIAFVGLVFFPLGRVIAALSGLGFHISTIFFLNINFYPLYYSYPILFDWKGLWQRFGKREGLESSSDTKQADLRSAGWMVHTIGIILVVGNIFCGFHAGYSRGWPYFTNYPSFAYFENPLVSGVWLTAKDDERVIDTIKFADIPWLSPHQRTALRYRFFKIKDEEAQKKLLVNLLEMWKGHDQEVANLLAQAVTIEITHVKLYLEPEKRGDPPASQELLMTFPWREPS